MGKTKITIVSILSAVSLIIVMLSPSLVETKALANSHPWADVYGFWYSDNFCSQFARQGYDTWELGWRWFSGTETKFEYDNPSLHYGLCYRGWSSTYYFNASASTP